MIKTDQPEKLELRSHDSVAEKKAELFRFFPEVRREGGKIDFEHLQRVLGETIDAGRERYGMNWPGKADCFKTIQTSKHRYFAALSRGVGELRHHRKSHH